MTAYAPPLHVQVLKPIVSVVRSVLPRSLFDALYKRAFAVYRVILAGIYARRLVTADKERATRTRSILAVMPYSLVGTGGLEATYDAAMDLEQASVEGAFVECGVARGGTAALMARVVERYGYRRHLWFFDSYEGLPEPGEADYVDGVTGQHSQEMPAGSCLGTEEEVAWLLFDKFKLDRSHITMVKGWFENTLHLHASAVGPIAILRIDADWYDSVKCCLDTLFDQVVDGGVVVIDDYDTCFGAKKAVDEFLSARGIDAELVPDGRGGVSFVR